MKLKKLEGDYIFRYVYCYWDKYVIIISVDLLIDNLWWIYVIKVVGVLVDEGNILIGTILKL